MKTNQPKSPAQLYPIGSKDGGWLYAIGLPGGVTKIGRTSRPRSRMLTHWRESKGRLEWMHLSGWLSADLIVPTEFAAMCIAARNGERVQRSEYFRGLPRDVAVRCIRQAIKEAPWQRRIFLERMEEIERERFGVPLPAPAQAAQAGG